MKKITTLLLTLLIITIHPKEQSERYAFCVVPVANVIGGEPMTKRFPTASAAEIKNFYNNFPNTNKNNKELTRMHQLLFNEIVEVIEENNAEYAIRMPNVLVKGKDGNPVPLCGYVYKDALVFVDTFENSGNFLPPLERPNQEPLTLQKNKNHYVYTLAKATFDYDSGCSYSMGTKFIGLPPDSHSDFFYLYRYAPTSKQITFLKLNKNLFMGYGDYKYENLEDCFVKTAERMAGNCPTTWGGKSFIAPIKDCCAYEEVAREYPDGSRIEGYDRQWMGPVRSGVDMSGMINILCKTCNIEFFLKNTSMMFHTWKPISIDAPDNAGSIVVFKGYAGIRSKQDSNNIIEARSYKHHNGMVRKAPLHKTFKDVTTWQDLVQQYKKNLPLVLIDDNGNELLTVREWKIVDFSAINSGEQ